MMRVRIETGGVAGFLILLPVRAYRFLLSPWLGANCRFVPSCSAYAIEAVETHGPWRGVLLSIKRLLRCHPLGGAGYDPIPDRQTQMPEDPITEGKHRTGRNQDRITGS